MLTGTKPHTADTLMVRLAAVLAEHRAVDVADADDHGIFLVWECTCGAVGEPVRVEPFSLVLGEARTHQAAKLTQAVAEWLRERSTTYEPTLEELASSGGTWTQLGAALALGRAARELRDEAGEVAPRHTPPAPVPSCTERVPPVELCSCGGRRWVDDENWAPELRGAGRPRRPGVGLIPCGACNHGGWNVNEWAVTDEC